LDNGSDYVTASTQNFVYMTRSSAVAKGRHDVL